jgi:hypothetical protein
MPSSELPFSTQPATESIATATRAPGPKRYTGTPIVTGEKETGGLVPGSSGTQFAGGPMMSPYMPGPLGMTGMKLPIPGGPMPSQVSGRPNTTPGGHTIPEHLYGMPGALGAFKKSGLPYHEWEQTMDASNYI